MPTIAPEPIGQHPTDAISQSISIKELESGASIFYLDYILRQQHCTKYFLAPNIEEAEKKCREYCRATRTKFVRVWPFLVDLDQEIKQALERANY